MHFCANELIVRQDHHSTTRLGGMSWAAREITTQTFLTSSFRKAQALRTARVHPSRDV